MNDDEIDEMKEAIKNQKDTERIGEGAFGNVYKLNFKGKYYAIKKISKDHIDNNPNVDYGNYLKNALFNEKSILKQMSEKENSVGFYGFYDDEKDYIIILEYCDTDLNKLLEKKGPFNSSEIRNILEGLNTVFKYMYKNNIVHRDIKPENILVKFIDSTKTKFIPKIGDYGLSKILENGKTSTLLGTSGYMSPELNKEKEYDNKCDLFSLGVTIYQLYFNSLPFQYKKSGYKTIYLKDTKKNDCEDKILDDLITNMLKFEPEERISWDEYFKHPFFNQKKEEELNNQQTHMEKYNEKEHQIINVYDFNIEKMLEILSHYDASAIVNITINKCLQLPNEPFFILGILGKYLEQIGISVTIERQEKLNHSWIISEYNKNIFQFICNSYILKSKYLLLFNFEKNKLISLVKNDIERGQFNEKVRKAIRKIYNLTEEEILTSNHRIEPNKFTVMIVIKSNFNANMTKDELMKVFSEDEELSKLEKVKKELLMPKLKLNLDMLFPQEDNKDNIWSKAENRGGEYYNPPLGWIKYGINVMHCFDDNNFDWLKKSNKREWCIAYCGITGLTKNMEQKYENENDIKHQNEKVGVGVICFSDPKLLEEYTETIQVNGENYKVGFQVRVKPNKIRVSEKNKNIWVVNGNENELRPYGILIKKV